MQTREKITYEIDPHNRLILSKRIRSSAVPKYRKVIDGRFQADKDNVLFYHIKQPQDSGLPQHLKLSGNYSLDKAHNLVITFDKKNNQAEGDKLTIRGEVLDVKDNELSFAVATKDNEGRLSTSAVKLNGAWQADRYNRLVFNAAKENGERDGLIFQGAWEVNRQNKLIYTHTKRRLKTKKERADAITFKGRWDITGKHRISYILNKEINSRFDFQVSVGRPLKRGLEYEIGIGAVPKKKKLILFGSWRINDKTGLLFEMPYEEGAYGVVFGAVCRLGENNTLDLKVQDARGEDLGMVLKFSRKILKQQGEIFIQALKSQKEVSLIAGMGFVW